MMHARPRIMMNAEHTKLKAIQGHTLDTLDINQLYEKIISIAHYANHPLWQGGVAPDTLVVEISHENYLDNWKRMGTVTPSISKKFHTMKAVRGTAPQDFGTSNVIICVFVSMKALFEFSLKIDMYIAPNGRIVTKSGLPWTAVTMVRRNNDEGSIINK